MAVKNVEEYINTHSNWENELRELHEMMLTTDLKPGIKWGGPVYMINGKNVLGIGAFKNHYGIWFFNGALLKENTALLMNAQEGKTKALRQIRFEKGDELNTSLLLPYVKEAIQNQKDGKIIPKAAVKKDIEIPYELASAFKNDGELKKFFQALPPGCKREYVDYLVEAKKEETRQRRLKKIIPMIKDKKGLHDKYKNC